MPSAHLSRSGTKSIIRPAATSSSGSRIRLIVGCRSPITGNSPKGRYGLLSVRQVFRSIASSRYCDLVTMNTDRIYHVDAFAWLEQAPPCSIHAVVTDPPYGLIEYRPDQLDKMRRGRGGVWRIPPSFDGCQRAPLPRFTVLTEQDRDNLRRFFSDLARHLLRVLVPGAHVFVATNPLVSHLVYEPFISTGFEKRGEIIRVV